jgi:hypothetical protein
MWKTVTDGLLGLLKNIREDRVQSQAQKDQALAAIIASANETKIYLMRIQHNGKRDRKTEEQLSRLWAAAAIPVRKINKDLAERCFLKSDYWLNPEYYTARDIEKFRIGVEQVYEEARNML